MDEQQQDLRSQQSSQLKPSLLVLCVLSICAIVISALTDVAFIFYSQMPRSQLEEIFATSGQSFESEQIDAVIEMMSTSAYHLMFNAVELVGVVLLLMRRFVGFHFYAASQIGFCAVYYMAFGLSASMTFIFFNLMWVVLYFLISRYLGKAQIQTN